MEDFPPEAIVRRCVCFFFFSHFHFVNNTFWAANADGALVVHDSILSVYSFKASHLVSIRLSRCLQNTKYTQTTFCSQCSACAIFVHEFHYLCWGGFYIQQNVLYEAIFCHLFCEIAAWLVLAALVACYWCCCSFFSFCRFFCTYFSMLYAKTVVSTSSMSSAIFMLYIE